jgi:hypothetical protein
MQLFFWIALAIVLVSAFHNRRPAKVRSASVEFAPRSIELWAWMYVVVRMCFISAAYLRHGLGEPLTSVTGALLVLSSVGSTFQLPGTILATDSGLVQVFWFWRNKKIRWSEIVEINAEKRSGAVTVLSADQTKIVHSGRLPDRPRFLAEIRTHCAENLPADFPGMEANAQGSV